MMRSTGVLALALLAAACSQQPASKDAPAANAPAAPAAATPAPATPQEEEPAARSVSDQERPHTSAPRITRAQNRTLCGEYEEIIYSCPIKGRTLSVCASSIDPADISYTYGRSLADVEMNVNTTRDDGRVHKGGVIGGGGGQQTYLRFSNRGTEYIVYSGYTGRLADVDRSWSGVAIYRDGREVANMECPFTGGNTQIASSHIPEFVPEETDGRYQAWY